MTPAKKAPASKAPRKEAARPRATKASADAAPARRTSKVAEGSGRARREPASPARGRTAKAASTRRTAAGPYANDAKFFQEQRHLLEHERDVYRQQAADLQAEADSLAQEREPGDVQFDEESGEGGTVTVDRERDLALSAQALAAVEEIEGALARIDDGSYGACERCHEPILKARLRALPYARLCVACKSGGLSRR